MKHAINHFFFEVFYERANIFRHCELSCICMGAKVLDTAIGGVVAPESGKDTAFLLRAAIEYSL